MMKVSKPATTWKLTIFLLLRVLFTIMVCEYMNLTEKRKEPSRLVLFFEACVNSRVITQTATFHKRESQHAFISEQNIIEWKQYCMCWKSVDFWMLQCSYIVVIRIDQQTLQCIFGTRLIRDMINSNKTSTNTCLNYKMVSCALLWGPHCCRLCHHHCPGDPWLILTCRSGCHNTQSPTDSRLLSVVFYGHCPSQERWTLHYSLTFSWDGGIYLKDVLHDICPFTLWNKRLARKVYDFTSSFQISTSSKFICT